MDIRLNEQIKSFSPFIRPFIQMPILKCGMIGIAIYRILCGRMIAIFYTEMEKRLVEQSLVKEVLPQYQGKSVGTELMKHMLGLLEHINCIDLTCDPNLQPFYKRFDILESNGMVIRKYLRGSCTD